MTVSDWGSAQAPFVAPGVQRGRSRNMNSVANDPVHGGSDPRFSQQEYTQRLAAAQRGVGAGAGAGHGAEGGFAGPRAYGTAPDPGAAARGSGPGGSTALNVVGALVSVALVAGLGVWGYKLAVRDVTGVPVVKALEGPMRIQPDDPGGVVAAHQGLAVNDVAAAGASAGPVDQLKLAPPAAELKAEDVPAHPEVEVEVTRAPESPATAPLPSNGSEINADAAVAEALGLTDVPGLDLPAADAPAGAAPLKLIPESVPGVTRSPRPMPRPAGYAPLAEITEPVRGVDVSAAINTPPPARPVERPVVPAVSEPAVVLGHEVDARAIDASARLVQLGAFRSVEEARAGWKEIAALNPELFENRNWTIEPRESGGTAFYRLRAIGFDGLQDARAFCAALIAAQGTCVPVVDSSIDTVTLAAPGAVNN